MTRSSPVWLCVGFAIAVIGVGFKFWQLPADVATLPQALWLSYSRETRRFREKVRLMPSRFLDELPAAELQRDGADPVADAERKKERASAGLAAIQAMFD